MAVAVAGPNRSDGEMERMTECLAGFWVTPSAGLPARCPCPAAPSFLRQNIGEVLEMTCIVDSLTIRLPHFLAPLYVIRPAQH